MTTKGSIACSTCAGAGWVPYHAETLSGETEEAFGLCPECSRDGGLATRMEELEEALHYIDGLLWVAGRIGNDALVSAARFAKAETELRMIGLRNQALAA